MKRRTDFEIQHAKSIAAAAYHHALAMDVGILSLYGEPLIAGYLALRCPSWSGKLHRMSP